MSAFPSTLSDPQSLLVTLNALEKRTGIRDAYISSNAKASKLQDLRGCTVPWLDNLQTSIPFAADKVRIQFGRLTYSPDGECFTRWS